MIAQYQQQKIKNLNLNNSTQKRKKKTSDLMKNLSLLAYLWRAQNENQRIEV